MSEQEPKTENSFEIGKAANQAIGYLKAQIQRIKAWYRAIPPERKKQIYEVGVRVLIAIGLVVLTVASALGSIFRDSMRRK